MIVLDSARSQALGLVGWPPSAADPKCFDTASREHYAALYARPGAMHAGFEQFKAFDQDAIDNVALLATGKLHRLMN